MLEEQVTQTKTDFILTNNDSSTDSFGIWLPNIYADEAQFISEFSYTTKIVSTPKCGKGLTLDTPYKQCDATTGVVEQGVSWTFKEDNTVVVT